MTIEDSSAPEAGYKSTFQVKPNAKCKFSTKETQQIIHDVLKEKLEGVVYNAETCSQLTKDISEDIKDRLKRTYCSILFTKRFPIGLQNRENCKS